MSQPNKYLEALEQLRDPFRLRMAVCIGALAIGFFSLYSPMDSSIKFAERQLAELKKQNAVLEDVKLLKEQNAKLSSRLGVNDQGACVQHVVDGGRSLSPKVLRLEPADPKRIGPLQAAAIHLDVQGQIRQLDALLHWLDTNPLLFRVESFHIAPGRDEDAPPQMQLKLLLLKEQA